MAIRISPIDLLVISFNVTGPKVKGKTNQQNKRKPKTTPQKS